MRRNYYQSASYEVVLNGVRDLPAKPMASTFKPGQEGEYDPLGESRRHALQRDRQYFGHGVSEPVSLQTPENLKSILDKGTTKSAGASVLVQAPSRAKGSSSSRLEQERVYETRVIVYAWTGNDGPYRLRADYVPNMYVVGLLVRPPENGSRPCPWSPSAWHMSVEQKTRAILWSGTRPRPSNRRMGSTCPSVGTTRRAGVAGRRGQSCRSQVSTHRTLAFFYRKNS